MFRRRAARDTAPPRPANTGAALISSPSGALSIAPCASVLLCTSKHVYIYSCMQDYVCIYVFPSASIRYLPTWVFLCRGNGRAAVVGKQWPDKFILSGSQGSHQVTGTVSQGSQSQRCRHTLPPTTHNAHHLTRATARPPPSHPPLPLPSTALPCTLHMLRRPRHPAITPPPVPLLLTPPPWSPARPSHSSSEKYFLDEATFFVLFRNLFYFLPRVFKDFRLAFNAEEIFEILYH